MEIKPQNKNANQKRFQSIFDLDVVKLVIDCLCRNLTTTNRPRSPTAKDKSIRNKFRFDSNNCIILFGSSSPSSTPDCNALENNTTV